MLIGKACYRVKKEQKGLNTKGTETRLIMTKYIFVLSNMYILSFFEGFFICLFA